MREICTSGLMSGDGKRGGAPASVLAPILDSTRQVLILQQEFLVDQSGYVGQKPHPMLGFKSLENARVVMAGIELAQKISKRPYDWRRLGGTDASHAHVWQRVMAA